MTAMMRQTILSLLLSLSLVASQGTDLAGRIVTRTNVDSWANLAMDVRDFHQLLESGQVPEANLLYRNGKHGDIIQPGVRQSLRSLSTGLVDSIDPTFLYHLYGLADLSSTNFRDQSLYGDNFVQSTMSSDNPALASTAVVVLIEWMYATHLLYQGVESCQLRSEANNPDLVKLGGGGMDEFIAFWIGRNQTFGSSDAHGLYAWTHQAGLLFGQDAAQEVEVNRQLKLLYQEGTASLNFSNACTKDNTDTVPQLWSVVQRMVSQMTIPLMQMLIYSIVEENSELVKLYSLALVPQVSQCRPSTFKKLRQELLEGTVDFDKSLEILRELRSSFECLGMSCPDVSEYKDWRCFDTPQEFPLADYTPTTSISQKSRIDLDLLQIKILTALESYQNAKFMYLYGRNSIMERASDKDPILTTTLHELASSSDRQQAQDFYSYFVGYHDNANYADKMVLETLNGDSKWETAEQRMEVVVKTCAFQILYLYALAEMASVVQDCRNNRVQDQVWDASAAYLIGSLEGPSADVDDGLLFWNLADKRAFQFNTLNAMGYSKVNSELQDLLFAGKGELDALDCDNLERTHIKIRNLLLIPLVQSTLRYAIANQDKDWDLSSSGLAKGEAFALTLLPVVAAKDEDAAQVLRENMIIMENVQPVRDGAQQVATVLYGALSEVMDCRQVGETDEIPSCSQNTNTDNGASTGLIISLSVLLLTTFVLCGYVVYKWWINDKEATGKNNETMSAESSETAPTLENQFTDVDINII